MVDMGSRRNERGGFTLVELLVAMAITAIVSVAILGLMNSTADSMRMAASASETLNRTRFAVERVRSFLRNAGAYASPDTRDDPRFKPPAHKERTINNSTCGISNKTTNARRLAGLVSYGGWQDYAG
ncbi:MAG: type II secretion system protein J, partial [Bradymonadaceae bacterium]